MLIFANVEMKLDEERFFLLKNNTGSMAIKKLLKEEKKTLKNICLKVCENKPKIYLT
jgi:hypothetical protein